MRTTWAEQVGGTASTDAVPWLENMGQLGSAANAPVPRFNQLWLCEITGYPVKPSAVCYIPKVHTPIHSSPTLGVILQKNKVKSKNTRYKTRVNKCRKTPTITGIARRFVVSINAMVAKTIPGERAYMTIAVLLFFLIACNVNTHHGGASLNGCCRCLT